MNRRRAADPPTARFALAFPPIILDGEDAETAETIVALGGWAGGGLAPTMRRTVGGRGSDDEIDEAVATVELLAEPRSFARADKDFDKELDGDETEINWSYDRAEIEANRAEWQRRRTRLGLA